MKWTLAYIIYLALIGTMSAMMYRLGYGITSCQWWISVACMIVTFMCGSVHERKSNTKGE